MSRYLIAIEKSENNFAANSPDLPGCVATGKTRNEVERRMQTAIALHLKGLREDGLPIPEPVSEAGYVAVPVE